jgi:hypothetical protein
MAATKSTYSPYQEEIIGLERQRDTMRKIREEATAPMQGQMVSGWYVGPSWSQGLANMLRGYIGKRGEEKAEAGIAERQKSQREIVSADNKLLARILSGDTTASINDIQTPERQDTAMTMMAAMSKPISLAEGGTLVNPRTGAVVAQGAPKSVVTFHPPAQAGIPAMMFDRKTGQVTYQDPADGTMKTVSFAQPGDKPTTPQAAVQPSPVVPQVNPAALAAVVRGDTAQPASPGVTTPLPSPGFVRVDNLPEAPAQPQLPTQTPAAAPTQVAAQQPVQQPVATQTPVAAQPSAQTTGAAQPKMPVRQPEPTKPPNRVTREEGGVTITEEWDAAQGKYVEVSRAPRWQPKAGVEQKPIPATILKQQDELLGQIGTAATTNAQLDKFSRQIAEGKLNLGLVANAMSGTQNFLGLSSDQSRNFASFKAMMEKMRNDSLRLNSGVQTEGDSQRAWSELLANINDPQVVQQRLAEIKDLNTRAIDERKGRIDAMRDNYGHAPYEPPTRPPATSTTPTATAPRAPSRAQQARPKGVGPDWELKQDAKGNRAWVSPDGKSFREVK